MKSILEQIFTEKIESLGQLKVQGSPNYQNELTEFLKLILKTSKDAEELANVTKKLLDVADNLAHSTVEATAKAAEIYRHLPDGKTRTYLLKAAIATQRAAMNNKVFEVYRMMFIQAEIIYAYLEKPFSLKDWAENENINKNKHNAQVEFTGKGIKQFTYTITKNNGVSPGSKPYILSDFFSEKENRILIASQTITTVKKMRDYASHGQHEDEVKSMRSIIGDATANVEFYTNKWEEFLTELTRYLP
ncbi:hypothetical protein GCM10027422_43120 [Hymenobacter arcticus]